MMLARQEPQAMPLTFVGHLISKVIKPLTIDNSEFQKNQSRKSMLAR